MQRSGGEASELPAEVMIAVGETRSFALPQLAHGGYRWRADVVGGDAGAIEASIAYAPLAAAPSPGRFAEQVLRVVGRRPGQASLRLSQGRSWEATAVREQDVNVTVVEEGNLPL